MSIFFVSGDAGDSEDRVLPIVVRVHFGNRDVEILPYMSYERLDDVSLVFEGMTRGNFQFKSTDANNHFLPAHRLPNLSLYQRLQSTHIA